MRGKVSIIKKIFIIQLFSVFLLTLSAKPYRVYPILFVHGINSGSGTWGAEVENREEGDWIPANKIEEYSTYYHFLRYMKPYVWQWYNWEKEPGLSPTFTPDPDTTPAYPNKTFLEIINFNDNRGSIDTHSGYLEPYQV
jgi:hypothetical protein